LYTNFLIRTDPIQSATNTPRVWGRLNGAPFAVERSTKLSKSGRAATSKLNVEIDGQDHTQQAIE
jgi:hypothetical protein